MNLQTILVILEYFQGAEERGEGYTDEKDRDRVKEDPDNWDAPREYIFGAGQSKRIWNELYKVRQI